MAGHGMVWNVVWHGMAWHGTAWYGVRTSSRWPSRVLGNSYFSSYFLNALTSWYELLPDPILVRPLAAPTQLAARNSRR